MVWAAIWDQSGRKTDIALERRALDQGAVPQAGVLLEGTVTRLARKPLRLWQGQSGSETGLAVYLLPDGAVRIIHGELDLVSAPAFVAEGEAIRLRYTTCALGRSGVVDLYNLDRGDRFMCRTGLATLTAAAELLPADRGFLDLFRGVAISTHGLPSTDLPGVAAGTLVDTPDGPRPVESLRPGDDVLTGGAAVCKLRWNDTREVVAIGQTAPVLIRAPYFGLNDDLRVTPSTRMLVSGAAVEYQFGTDAVLIRACDMVNNVSIKRDHSRPVIVFHHLMLDDHDCVSVGRCRVETVLLSDLLAADGAQGAARLGLGDSIPRNPVLDRPAAQALLALLPGARRAA